MTTTQQSSGTAAPTQGVAQRLAGVLQPFLGGPLPVRLRCWDGSEFVPPGDPAASPVVELRSPDAVRRLLWHPGELGAAQAYVTGELDVLEVDGWDLDKALTHSFAVAAERGLSGARIRPAAVVEAVSSVPDSESEEPHATRAGRRSATRARAGRVRRSTGRNLCGRAPCPVIRG